MALLLWGLGAPTWAQDRADTILDIEEVVVHGSRTREVIAPQHLAGKELKRLNTNTVADALRYFAGVQLKDYGGVGGLKTVNIRSMGSHHVGVYYDGVQLGNAQNGQVDLGKFSLDNVGSISLYNGQKSEIFQSAREFGSAGTIYIISRRPMFLHGREGNLRATVRTGSFGLLNPSVLYEYRVSQRVSASFSAEWVHAHGRYRFRYRRRDLSGAIAYDTVAVRHNGDVNATRMEGAVYGMLPGGNWQVRVYNYNSERGMPGAIVNNVWKRGERLWDRNSFIQGTLRSTVTPYYRTQAVIKYAYDYTHYINKDARLLHVDNSFRQQEAYLSSSHLFTIAKWCDVSAAYDFQYNTLMARDEARDDLMPDFPIPLRFSHFGAAATSLHWGGLKAQLSVMGTYVQNRTKRLYSAPDKMAFQPGAFVSYTPYEPLGLSVVAFYKKSFRMPTFNDLYYTDLGNSNLRPEYVRQYNVGLRWAHEAPRTWCPSARISVDAYYNQVWDKIVAYPKGQQFRWTMLNLGYVEIRGIDALAETTVSPARDWAILVKAQYTYQRAQDFTNPDDNFYGHQIPYIPWHSGSAIVGLAWREYSFNYSFIYAGERYNQQENILYNYTQPWYTSDLSLRGTFRVGEWRLTGALEVNNLLSQDYDVILNYPMPKRNYRVSFTAEF